MTLRTERLVMRRWLPSDREPFAALTADPVVQEHFPAAMSRAEAEALADHIEAGFELHEYGLWAVEVPGEAPFIGYVGLAHPTFEAHFTPAVEVGWRLARPFWGRGYATEAGRAALRCGFVDHGLTEIVSFTVPQNVRSRAVMERLGMTHDEADDFDHPRFPNDDRMRRHVLYRLRRSDWVASPP